MKQDFNYTPYVPTQAFDLGTTKQYFDTLPESDISKQYFNGLVYKPDVCRLGRVRNFFTLGWKMHALEKLYPYQKNILETKKQMEEDQRTFLQNSFYFTAAAWTFIFQYGRRGQVLPILKEYGSVLKTHRIFRQYLYTLVFPLAIASYYYDHKFNDHIEILWKTHSNRMNQKILTDPVNSEYPEELRAPRRTIFENHYY